MGRREERVDEEELARLESSEGGASTKIRVKMPNSKINEMFALAEQILGGRRVNVLCADGEMRLARIPGKMRRRQWVREGDLIIVWPWDFQDSKADVKHRYTKTQAMYLSRKGILPEIVDMFGMNAMTDDLDSDEDDLFGVMDEEESEDDMFDDDGDDLFGDDDDDDDLFGEDSEDDEVEGSEPAEAEESEPEIVDEYAHIKDDDDDDDDDDLDSFFS